jgi:hypothetical protein
VNVRFEVFKEVSVKITDVWNMTPYSSVDEYQTTRRHIPEEINMDRVILLSQHLYQYRL